MFYRRLEQNREPGNSEMLTQRYRVFITVALITVNAAIQKVITFAVLYTMIRYLTLEYQMTFTEATNVVFYCKVATSCMSTLIAYLSDSFRGRFFTIGLGSLSTILGIFSLWLTTMNPGCDSVSTQSCASSIISQRGFVFLSLGLISVGAGCVRCSTAFAADQLEMSQQQGVLERFFMFYYVASSLPTVFAFTGAAHMVDTYGWEETFGVPLIPLVLCVVMFFLASPLYVKEKPNRNLISSFTKVVVAAYRNRKLPFPSPNNTSGAYLPSRNSEIVVPSDKLRFLNKACMVSNREQEIAPDGSAVNSWTLCSIEQVEEFKTLLYVILLWSAGIVLWVNASQGTFMLLQAGAMDRKISQNIKIPVAVFGTCSIFILAIGMILYDFAILPLVSKIKGEPVQPGVKSRMGTGLLLSWTAMVASAVVESIRHGKAVEEGNSLAMSAFWLLPQYCLLGLSLAIAGVAQIEFLYTELPRNMWSIAADLMEQGMTVAGWLSSFVVDIVSNLTSEKGKLPAWNDMNNAPVDLVYLAFAIISFFGLFYCLFCSRTYGTCKQRRETNDNT